MIETLHWFWSLTLMFLVWAAAIKDMRSFTIPHIYPILGLGLLFFVTIFFLVEGGSFRQLPWQVLGGVLTFFVSFVMFALRIMGGGDVKLLSAITPMIAFSNLLILFVLISLSGLVWSLCYVTYITLRDRKKYNSLVTAVRAVRGAKLPYGPAIALGVTLYFIIPKFIY